MPVTAAPEVAVIGCGPVGSTLAHMLQQASWPVVALASRREETAKALAQSLAPPAPKVCGPAEAAAAARLVLLTVPDAAVSATAQVLAPAVKAETVVAHTSGALASSALEPLDDRGARLLAAHPIQTIPDAASGQRLLPGTVWGLEGDEAALAMGRRMVEALDGRWLQIDAEHKLAYHAACALAANQLVALASLASHLFAQATGSPRQEALTALLPLMAGAVHALEDHGLPQALTGPILRGDAATVAGHVAALLDASKVDPRSRDLPDVYRLLGREALRLAREAGTLETQELERIEGLLSEW